VVTGTGTRACPGGCGRLVGHVVFACRACWGRLPEHLRTDIKTAYRRRAADPAPHTEAMLAARRWYADDTGGGR
jgi:hypothetical protein